jgi:hypothetical protein
MFGSQILEVAIGIVFVYLLLSLICSTLSELISRAFAMRSNNLDSGIQNLLNDLRDQNDHAVSEQFYKHPLIDGLDRNGWFDRLIGRRSKPSYIPSRTFVLTLLDIIAPANTSAGPQTFQDIRNALVALPDSKVKRALLVLIDAGRYNLQEARGSIENWFNDAMDRVSGWYKRKIQLIILGLALLVSAGLNADTIMIAKNLWRDPTLRASVVAAAQEAAKQPSPVESKPSLTRITQIQSELQQLQLPIGWSDPRLIPSNFIGVVAKIVGLLFTMIAVSLGAPFWFDLLSKFINLRSSGNQPEKTPER